MGVADDGAEIADSSGRIETSAPKKPNLRRLDTAPQQMLVGMAETRQLAFVQNGHRIDHAIEEICESTKLTHFIITPVLRVGRFDTSHRDFA